VQHDNGNAVCFTAKGIDERFVENSLLSLHVETHTSQSFDVTVFRFDSLQIPTWPLPKALKKLPSKTYVFHAMVYYCNRAR
jgi:hypothetical protein